MNHVIMKYLLLESRNHLKYVTLSVAHEGLGMSTIYLSRPEYNILVP